MRIVSIASARPNFVKLAAIQHAASAPGGVEHLIVHTGQHFDPLFSDVFFDQLSIPRPTKNLGIAGGAREETIERTKVACRDALRELRPDIVLVYGDVNGAVGGALAAKELEVPLAHVEAGLRSFDSAMPEEHNRIAIDGIADLLFCTEQSGVDHLKEENIPGAVHLVGNTMIDTLVRMTPFIGRAVVPVLPQGAYGVVTLHRPSNVDARSDLARCVDFLGEVARHTPLVLPLHHRLQHALTSFGFRLPSGVTGCPPLGYVQFLRLMRDSAFILTDSGGVQEEATFLKKRCFTMRRNTERPSTIESGSNVLIDPMNQEDCASVVDFAKNPRDPKVSIPEMWDGKAGERIIRILLEK